VNALVLLGVFGALGFFEFKTAFRSNLDTPMGKTHASDYSKVWSFGVAGTYNFDPLDLYSSLGKDAYGRKALRDTELQQGRYAMLAIAFFSFYEATWKTGIVDGAFGMFFHPNLLLPALGLGYWYWSSIFEISPIGEFPIGVQYRVGGIETERSIKASLAGLVPKEKVEGGSNDSDGENPVIEAIKKVAEGVKKAAGEFKMPE